MRLGIRTSFLALFSLVVLHGSVAAAGVDPTDKCVAAKINASGKRFAAISKCRAKAVLAGTAVDPGCLDKAERKFLAAFAKAESRGACTVTGDAATIDDAVSVCTDTINDDLARLCGDGAVAPSEACDDGNQASIDGCSATCAVETDFECTGEPSVCTSTCGDGIIASDEGCDDGGHADGDGCSASCGIESGYTCAGEPSACATVCGDGLIRGTETCDDGGTVGGDGCTATCGLEDGWDCSGEPTICACSIVPLLYPMGPVFFIGDVHLDASFSYSGCGLPLQYFWDCYSDTIDCPNFLAAANSNGNTNAAPTLSLPYGGAYADLYLTICFAGTSDCAPQIHRLYSAVTP